MTVKALIGTRIKSLRNSKGWTQENLSERMDISLQYLSSMERGKENPTLDMLIKLSNALEVEMWEIFDFGHEVSQKELKSTLSSFIKNSTEEKLRLALKVIRAVSR